MQIQWYRRCSHGNGELYCYVAVSTTRSQVLLFERSSLLYNSSMFFLSSSLSRRCMWTVRDTKESGRGLLRLLGRNKEKRHDPKKGDRGARIQSDCVILQFPNRPILLVRKEDNVINCCTPLTSEDVYFPNCMWKTWWNCHHSFLKVIQANLILSESVCNTAQ
jgi:hypothetical protein